ncbi:MAG TPA: hypothetical protein VEK85_06905 [Gemmatimonadales bacterium]|nr:hypothetical protein [Gemmatimonadales bacterium]
MARLGPRGRQLAGWKRWSGSRTAARDAAQTSGAVAPQIASLGELTTTSQQLSVAAARLTETIQRFNVNGAKLSPPK